MSALRLPLEDVAWITTYSGRRVLPTIADLVTGPALSDPERYLVGDWEKRKLDMPLIYAEHKEMTMCRVRCELVE
eukprot:3374520-Karenia_brevis.AAC.1